MEGGGRLAVRTGDAEKQVVLLKKRAAQKRPRPWDKKMRAAREKMRPPFFHAEASREKMRPPFFYAEAARKKMRAAREKFPCGNLR